MPDLIPSEELVKSSEEHFSFIADFIPTLVWLANADGWIFWYNRSWYEYTGTTPEQMKGWGWQSVHDPAALPSVMERWNASIATGAPFEMVFPLRGSDGIFRPFLTRINTICDAHGKVLRWVGTNTNIHGQRQAEASLVEKDSQLRAAFRQTYSFMVLLSTDGTILEANDAALQAINSARRDVVGRKFWEGAWWASLPDEVKSLQASIRKAAAGESVREECRYVLADGAVRFAERTFNPVKDENGGIAMVVASGIDTTEQKELREQLEQRVQARTEDLKEKNNQLMDLSARLLHSQDDERRRLGRDLHDSAGQLIAALLMNIAVVQNQTDRLTPDAAAAVRQNAQLLRQLSEEIRTMSQLLHPPLLDEVGLLAALRSYAEGFADRSKTKVTLDLPEVLDLPESMKLPMFRIVQECLTNIYRHSGSATAFIRISKPSPDRISVMVRDEGKGISAGTSRGGNSRGPHGVGLSGMRERVREFGGTIEIQSSGAGTTVTAILPLTQSVVADADSFAVHAAESS